MLIKIGPYNAIPAKAGIQASACYKLWVWIPAFAGMTMMGYEIE